MTGLAVAFLMPASLFAAANDRPNALRISYSVTTDWRVSVEIVKADQKPLSGTFDVIPTAPVQIHDEPRDRLRNFETARIPGWRKGSVPSAIKAQECSVRDALIPESVVVTRSVGGNPSEFVRGRDFEVEPLWGAVGRIPAGAIPENQAVFLTYMYYPSRIDSVVIAADAASLTIKQGVAHAYMPEPPALEKDEIRVLNIYQSGKVTRLEDRCMFPVTEEAFPAELAAKDAGSAHKYLPKTMQKLRNGEKLKILAWGDSVTEGSYLPNKERDRWQQQFVTRLREKYPQAQIDLQTEAWPGRSSAAYLAEPPGSVHNFQEKVLNIRPDLIIIEFVNDGAMKKADVDRQYGRFIANFRAIGAECIIHTPHYVRPDWMNLTSQKNIDRDPREYVPAIRSFCAANGVALSDVSLRYGRLWRQGIPYLTMLHNNINHPNAAGMAIYADALMNLFPQLP